MAALVRGLEKYGGELRLRQPVAAIEVEDGRAAGVRLENGHRIRAKHVVSNAPVWATAALLPEAQAREARGGGSALDGETPPTPSFIHLHLGIRGDGLSEQALSSIHHIVVPSWERLMAPQSTVFVSIPSLIDPSLAPPGKHVIHAYLPATEPYELWEGLDRKSEEYKALKRERANCLFTAIEQFIPDIREVPRPPCRCQLPRRPGVLPRTAGAPPIAFAAPRSHLPPLPVRSASKLR